MRYFLLGVILLLSVPHFVATPARADTGLTSAVAAAYFPRTVDAGLHSVAHQRVVEISSCAACMNHDLMRSGTAEVIGYNAGYADPIATVLSAWRTSPMHNGILSDRDLGRIGCAERVVGGEHYFVCVLAAGGGSSSPSGSILTLPDTAMHPGERQGAP